MNLSQAYKPPKVSLLYKERKIILYDDINEDTAFEFVNCVERLLSLDSKIGSKEPLEIMINSFGGSVYDGVTIVSKIEKLKSLGYIVTTTNIGLCASMAFIISVCGTKKRCYKYSTYMYHDTSFGFRDKLQSIREETEHVSTLKKMIDNVVVTNTNITQDQLDDWCDRKIDKYFYANQALDLKISDEVL